MTEQEIIQGLKDKRLEAFQALVDDYADEMTTLAYILLKRDRQTANGIVDEILIGLRNGVGLDQLTDELGSYLMEQVRVRCTDLLPPTEK
jgi:hypothetical protein